MRGGASARKLREGGASARQLGRGGASERDLCGGGASFKVQINCVVCKGALTAKKSSKTAKTRNNSTF